MARVGSHLVKELEAPAEGSARVTVPVKVVDRASFAAAPLYTLSELDSPPCC